MADEIYVQIITADGTELGEVWEDSVELYALRQLKKANQPVIKTMYVEMLNYGAAAQVYFKYDVENLANAELTEEEKAYGLETVKLENNRVADENYEGSQLNLVNSIQLRMQFKNIDSSMYAISSFTNHLGKKVETRIDGSEFIHEGRMVVVKTIVAADYKQDVTVTVYSAEGEAVATAVDSVASYIARMSSGNAIYDAVAKFTAAAHAYLHRNDG